MAFDLDDDELRATREMHKLSDKNVASEEDIKILENYLKNSAYKQSNSDFFKNGGWEIVDLKVPQAIEHILAEREQDKARIKELEEKNKILNCQNKQVENYAEELKIEHKIAKVLENARKQKGVVCRVDFNHTLGTELKYIDDYLALGVLAELFKEDKAEIIFKLDQKDSRMEEILREEGKQ